MLRSIAQNVPQFNVGHIAMSFYNINMVTCLVKANEMHVSSTVEAHCCVGVLVIEVLEQNRSC